MSSALPEDCATEDDDRARWHGLYLTHVEDLLALLRERLLTIYKAHRLQEQQTGFVSRAAMHNLVDVLAHIGTLAQKADTLNFKQQGAHVVNIEDHLRRAAMEAQEDLVRFRLGDELAPKWTEQQRVAGPLRETGELRGVPTQDSLEALRQRIDSHIEAGRSRKPDATWEEWLDGAGEFKAAAELANELSDKLEVCIGAAQRIYVEKDRDKKYLRYAIAGMVVSFLVGVGGTVLTLALTG